MVDLTSLTDGGKPPEKEQAPALEYTAQAASTLVNGEVKLTVDEDVLAVTALLDAAVIPFADIMALELADYAVTVKTDGGKYTFSRMGSWCQPFYDTLYEAYNQKVLKALFVAGKPALETKGSYRYVEDGLVTCGTAPIHIFDNCVCVLPPNLDARRIPLCFVSGIEKKDYTITLRLNTGDSYAFEKLGYDSEPFVAAIEKQMRRLREKALAAVKSIDPTLTVSQASALARLVPEGVAAPAGQLTTIAPSFVPALERAIADSRAADSYAAFKEICDPSQIFMGFKKDDGRGGAGSGKQGDHLPDGLTETGVRSPTDMVGKQADRTDDTPTLQGDFMLWMIAPSPNGHACAVEFAGGDGAAAATFVYVFDGSYDTFAREINRALEATAFKREVIRLTDEEMQQPQNSDYHMAVQRTCAIQLIRNGFVGRAIHTNEESWKKQLLALWNLVPC